MSVLVADIARSVVPHSSQRAAVLVLQVAAVPKTAVAAVPKTAITAVPKTAVGAVPKTAVTAVPKTAVAAVPKTAVSRHLAGRSTECRVADPQRAPRPVPPRG